MKNYPSGFTLVELIVVITILAILGTIGFISLQGYTVSARDSVRISDIGNINRVLSLYHLQEGEYPMPGEGFSITHTGEDLWTQGVFDDSVRAKLGSRNISHVPVDPLTQEPYMYSVTSSSQEFQIGGIAEGGSVLSSNASITPRTYAEARKAIVQGNYNGALISRTIGNEIYLFGVPSILARTVESSDILTLIENNLLIIDGYGNMPINQVPDNENIRVPTNLGIQDAQSIIVFQGSKEDFVSPATLKSTAENISDLYSGSNISSLRSVQPFIFLELDCAAISSFIKLLLDTNTAPISTQLDLSRLSYVQLFQSCISFANINNIEVNTLIESNIVQISGFDGTLLMNVNGDGSPQFRINGESWDTSGSVKAGDEIQLRLTSSSILGDEAVAVLSIGDFTTNWSVTTSPPISIHNCQELQDIRLGADLGYRLENNINCQGFAFVPIPGFSGILDGNGFTISNLNITSSLTNVGLFSTIINAGKIFDLNLHSIDIRGDSSGGVGAIAGLYSSSSPISNIQITSGLINGSNSNTRVGGFFGHNSGGNLIIENSSFQGGSITANRSTSSGINHVGGFIGFLASGDLSILDSEVTVNTLSTRGGRASAGGFIGQINSGGNLIIENSSFQGGSITANNSGGANTNHVGGFIGFLASGDLSILDSEVTVNTLSTAGGAARAGGFIGQINSGGNLIIENSSFQGGSITANNSGSSNTNHVGGFIGLFSGVNLSISNSSMSLSQVLQGGASAGGLIGNYNSNRHILLMNINSQNILIGEDLNALYPDYNIILGISLSVPISITGGVGKVGGFMGEIRNGRHLIIENSSFQGGSITANNSGSSGINHVGGLVGFAGGNFSVTNSQASVNTLSTAGGAARGGGLVGNVSGAATVENSSFQGGSITANRSGSAHTNHVGGLVGFAGSTSSMINASALVNVSSAGGSAFVGGLIGRGSFDITNSFAVGTMAGSATRGGVIGNRTGGVISNAYWDSEVSGLLDGVGIGIPGGVGLNTSQMQGVNAESNMTGFDFTDIWIVTLNEYPKLR